MITNIFRRHFNNWSNGVSAVLWYTKHFWLVNLDRQKLDLLLRSGLQTCLLHSSKDPQKLITLRRFFSKDQQVVPFSISNCVSTAVTHQQLKQIHSLIITSGLHQSVFFSGKLISKYSQFQNPNASRLVFRQTSHPNNIFLWNSIIRALTQNGMFLEALEVFSEMRKLKLRPDSFTFPSVINACAGSSNIEMGRVVHDCVLEMGFSSDLFIGNSLIDMYSRFGCLDEARNVFERIPKKDPVSWNSLISGYCANGEWSQAIDFYYQSRILGMIPDSFTVSSVLPAFGSKLAINEGKMIHGLIHKIGVENDRLVNNGLLSMYCKCEALTDAQRVFDVMEQRDTVSWNTVICGYSQMGLFPEAVKLFKKMIIKFKPDLLTVTSVLRACGHMEDLEFGKSVHKFMNKNGYEYDTMASNILITMYARCGDLKSSRKVFDEMVCRDSVSWNSMVNGYIQNELYNEGMVLFNMMKESEFKPDSVTHVLLLSMCSELVDLIQGKKLHCSIIKMGFHSYLPVANTVVDMYAKCVSLEDALKKFEEIKARDVVSWNSIITGCVHSGDCNLGLKIVSQMRAEGLIPDVATLLGNLPACSFLASKRRGKEIHGFILKFGFESELPIGNALIEMYSKCGNLENALRVFRCMEVRDVVTWTALVSAYGMYGEGKKALGAFSQMESRGIIPDHVSFVAVIYACSHSGLTEDGLGLFQRLKEKYKIEPTIEHYACVVDLLSRSGCFAEAEEFVLAIPLKPDASIWGALLSSCRATGESQIAERISRRILELDSDDSGYHVLVSNVYAALGKWDKVGKIRKSLRGKGLKKNPGCSWIEIGNRVYAFGTGDKFVEQSEEVYRLLERLTGLMAKEGYIADQKFVLHDVEEDEKIDMLCGHSERLAIAFGLLNTSPGTALQIMKNLRVCGDCHTVIKYISKILQRELLVRDANRFHLFKDGACSCGDFW